MGLGRVELPTNGLGIGQLSLNLYVFSVFSSVNFVLFWAYSGAERATDLATAAPIYDQLNRASELASPQQNRE